MSINLQSINHFSLLKSTADYSKIPTGLAVELGNEDSFLSQIGSRALLLVQTVTSLIALPLILLLGLFEAAFHTLTCNGSKATTTLKATLEVLTDHLLFVAPASLVGALTPDCIRNPIIGGLGKVNKEVTKLWQFNCCESISRNPFHDYQGFESKEWSAEQQA